MGTYQFSESNSNILTASDFWVFNFSDNGTCVQLEYYHIFEWFPLFEKVGKLRFYVLKGAKTIQFIVSKAKEQKEAPKCDLPDVIKCKQ